MLAEKLVEDILANVELLEKADFLLTAWVDAVPIHPQYHRAEEKVVLYKALVVTRFS